MLIEGSKFNFENFKCTKVLKTIPSIKQINLLGYFNDENKKAIILIRKYPFETEDSKKFCFSKDVSDVKVNDIYSSFTMLLPENLSAAKINVVYPATEKHILKYSSSIFFTFVETPKIYCDYTFPYLQSNKFDLKWVDNILDGLSEQESIILKDTNLGIILLQDLSWDGKSLTNLHILGLPLAKGISSIRDLNDSHLSLLEGLELQKNNIAKKYNISKNLIEAYFHYPPTFYHLHIHYTLTTNIMPEDSLSGNNVTAGRNIYLTDTMQNIKLKSDYYRNIYCATIYLSDNSDLFPIFNMASEGD